MKNSKFLSIVLSVVLSVLGVALLAQAATTISTSITTAGNITTSAGNLEVTAGTLTVGGASTLTGAVGITGLTTLVNASTTRVSVSTGLWVNGMATTTSAGAISTRGSLTVGANGSAISNVTAGYCTIAGGAAVATTTLNYYDCVGATGVASGDRIMIMATSSLGSNFSIAIASSTAADHIQVGIRNLGLIAGNDPGVNSFNFFAVTK